jgi:hypothetical protein
LVDLHPDNSLAEDNQFGGLFYLTGGPCSTVKLSVYFNFCRKNYFLKIILNDRERHEKL